MPKATVNLSNHKVLIPNWNANVDVKFFDRDVLIDRIETMLNLGQTLVLDYEPEGDFILFSAIPNEIGE